MMKYAVGIDVGGSHIKFGLFDPDIQLVSETQFPTDKEVGAIELADFLAHQVQLLVSRYGLGMSDIRGVGAAFPSFVDYEKGLIVDTSNIMALNDQPMRDMLSQRLGVPVCVDNDGNLAALAEHRLGAGRGHDNLIYATLATGIGGGLILNGRLFRGMHGMAGEIGHMFVSDSTGCFCGCGVTGCVQSVASGNSMAEYAINRIKEGEESRILDYAGTLSRIDMLAVSRAYAAGDKLAAEVLDRGADYLGRMFRSLYQIFDINVFVYGGGVMKIGPAFTDRIITAYRRYASQMELRYPAQFLPAELGDNTGMIGAALLVP